MFHKRHTALAALALMSLTLLCTLACSGSSSRSVLDPDPPLLMAGETIPIGTTVTINVTATYPLTPGTNSLRTRCTGEVTVIIDRGSGDPEVNICDSDGSSSQLNSVVGLSSVDYELAVGASARVTAN